MRKNYIDQLGLMFDKVKGSTGNLMEPLGKEFLFKNVIDVNN